MDRKYRILVVFVEPMIYGLDIISEVYEETEYEYFFVYCNKRVTGKDDITLPENSAVLEGGNSDKIKALKHIYKVFQPDLSVINGYTGAVQVAAIRYCIRHRISYAIESDTQKNIPHNILKRAVKKIVLKKRLGNDLCYGFAGGTLQKENLIYFGINESRCYIMPMAISTKRLNETGQTLPDKERIKEKHSLSGKTVFLSLGRLVGYKRVDLLIEAFEQVSNVHHNAALVIVGDGDLKSQLEDYVNKKRIANVFFEGYIGFPENVEYYKMADVFIIPSQNEPWGLVVNEALAMGIPVIASDTVGCVMDLISNGENGFVFKSNDKKDLAEKMSKIFEYDIERLSGAARERAGRWNLDYYRKCFISAVEEILN